MKIIIFCYFYITFAALGVNAAKAINVRRMTKKSRCLNPPRTARRVENFINECQEEVKNKLVYEAFQILKDEVSKNQPTFDEESESIVEIIDETSTPAIATSFIDESSNVQHEYNENDVEHSQRRTARVMQRIKRISDPTTGIYHPTLVPSEDKRIAGCLLHCVYAKNNAIDQLGWPTLDGLVHFYSEGVNEHGFFMATLRSVNLCLRAVTVKYRVNRRKQPERGESCDLAFDVFDCISDQITGYCLDQYK